MKTASFINALKREFPKSFVLGTKKEDGIITFKLRVNDRPLTLSLDKGDVVYVSHREGSKYMDIKSKRSTISGAGYTRLLLD